MNSLKPQSLFGLRKLPARCRCRHALFSFGPHDLHRLDHQHAKRRRLERELHEDMARFLGLVVADRLPGLAIGAANRSQADDVGGAVGLVLQLASSRDRRWGQFDLVNTPCIKM